MPYFTDATDDVLVFDGIRQFTGGQASGLQADLLAENQVQTMQNMTISPRGRIETRYGFENFATGATCLPTSIGGLAYYDTSANEQLLTVANGRLSTIINTGANTLQPALAVWSTTTSTWSGLTQTWQTGFSNTPTSRVNMTQFNDLEYICDGVGPLMFWDGTTVKRQSGKLRAISVTTAGSGYTTATAIVTGPDLGGVPPTLITQTAGGAVTSVIVSDNSGAGYSTAPTVTIIGDGSGATATAVVGTAPTGLRILVTSANRLFAVGSGADRNTLHASDILDAAVWATNNSIVVGAADGEEIIAVVPFYANRLIVFKPSKIYQVSVPANMTSAADWVVEIVSSTVGCVAERSAVQVNSDVFFLSGDGIRSLSRSVSDDFTAVGMALSEIIKDVILEISPTAIGVSTAIYHDNRYILTVPTGASDICNTIIVYNTILQAFEGTWSFAVNQFVDTNFASQGHRLAAKKADGVITDYNGYKTLANTVAADYQDSGAFYASFVLTRSFIFGDPFADKHGSHFEVSFDKTFSQDVDVFVQRDTDSSPVAVLSNIDASTASLVLPFVIPAILTAATQNRVANDLRFYEKWRSIAIQVGSDAGQFSVRQIITAANPDTIETQKTI